MLIKRSRTLTFQPRQYESIVVSAGVEFEFESMPKARKVEEFADETLTLLLKGEIDEAAAVTDNPKSFISTYRYSGE